MDSECFVVIFRFKQFVNLTFAIMRHNNINKIVMQHFIKNGQYFQRKKLFLQDPFHNMKSHISLDWQTQEATSQELQRAKMKQIQQHQNLRKIYNQQVEMRMQRRFGDLSTISTDLSHSRNQDILSREVENFRQSKVISGDSIKEKKDNREYKAQNQILQNRHSLQPSTLTKGLNPTQPPQNYNRFDRQKSLQEKYSHDQTFKSNPQLIGNSGLNNSRLNNYSQLDHSFKTQQSNSPLAYNRYQSLDTQKSPYPKEDLSKLLQELYTGNKVQQYPFRNVIPDKLQSHLREKTKADRKRTYQMALNLFKH